MAVIVLKSEYQCLQSAMAAPAVSCQQASMQLGKANVIPARTV